MRWVELLEYIEAEPGIAPDDLAARMGVSARTVRSFAREASDHLGNSASLEKRRGGGTRFASQTRMRTARSWLAPRVGTDSSITRWKRGQSAWPIS